MSIWWCPNMHDGGLNYFLSKITRVVALSAAPTDYTDTAGVTANKLAEISSTSADYTLENGDVDGRQLSAATLGPATASAGGAYAYTAFMNDTDGEILALNPGTAQTIAAGNPIYFNAMKIRSREPVSV